MRECFRGGLKTPRIVQEAVNEATILSLVSHGLGVGFVNGTARWRCPKGVVVLPVSDLNVSLQLALVWRKDNASPLLARFVAGVQDLPPERPVTAARSNPCRPGRDHYPDHRVRNPLAGPPN